MHGVCIVLAHNHTGYISQNCLVHPTLKMTPQWMETYVQANMRAVTDHSSDPRAEFLAAANAAVAQYIFMPGGGVSVKRHSQV